MSWLKNMFDHDYERDGPGFYDPKQPATSLLKCMLIWVGVNVCIDVLVRSTFDNSTTVNVYSKPWLLLIWMTVGALMWCLARLHYLSWIAKRSESSSRVASRAVIERGVQP